MAQLKSKSPKTCFSKIEPTGAESAPLLKHFTPADDSEVKMFVFVKWNDRKLAVPLEQLKPIRSVFL